MDAIIVEDFRPDQILIKRTITDFFPHASIDIVDSVNEAIEALHNKSYNLIILDLKFPGKSGLDFLLEVDRSILKRQSKIFVLTHLSLDDAILESVKDHVDEYIMKDKRLSSLKLKIKKHFVDKKSDNLASNSFTLVL